MLPEGMDGKYMGNSGKQVDLRQAIGRLDALPAMPVIAQKLLALHLDTEEGERQLLILIEEDPQISAKILGLANSALIGSTRHITTVKEAALLLGIKRVQTVSTGIAIMSLMNRAPSGRFNMQDLWLHSIGIAFAMLGIARLMPAKVRPQDDQIFLAGMLHDIGYLALAFLDPWRSDRLHAALAAEPERPALEIERKMLEMTHDELGAELARHWHLPEEIIAMLRSHHAPAADTAAPGQLLALMVNVAEKLLPSFGLGEYVAPGVSDAEWGALGIDPARASEVEEQVDEQAEQASQFATSFE